LRPGMADDAACTAGKCSIADTSQAP
jgi:hypothetical protein